MKILLSIVTAALVTASTALAHEGHEHPAGGGLLGLPPEYVHVLLNPLPTELLEVAALASQKKFPKAITPLAAVTLIAAGASLGAGGWISKAGGQVRSPEFRQATTPESTEQHHHHDDPPE